MNKMRLLTRSIASIALMVTMTAVPGQSTAWEAQTTHAGLAEQAALASALHERLLALGFSGGLFEALTIPPADAPALIAVLARLSPTHGTLPDTRGRMTALSWLAAGAAIADSSADTAANHFYDPHTKAGYTKPSRTLGDRIGNAAFEQMGRSSLPRSGEAATTWITSKNNPLALSGFYDQYVKAVTATTPGERARHMAAALISAGSALHALGDMGTPSHVRSDVLEHTSELSTDRNDIGSRFERIAALAFGRLGVPAPSRIVTRDSVEAFFTNPANNGLADITASSYFSLNTLPRQTTVTGGNAGAANLSRPAPALPKQLNLMAASRGDGATLRNDRNVCLARYRVANGNVSFFTDDDCQLEQISALLPEVASFEAGLLEFLFRGQLQVVHDGQQVIVTNVGKAVGAGTVTIVAQDANGVRTVIANAAITATSPTGSAQSLTSAAAAGNLTWYAVYRGVDGNGQPLVSIGRTLALPASSPTGELNSVRNREMTAPTPSGAAGTLVPAAPTATPVTTPGTPPIATPGAR